MEKRSGSQEVKPFSFTAFEEASETVGGYKNFEFRDLTGLATQNTKPTSKIIRSEREAEAKTQFKIDAIVRDMRGLSSQEKDDLETRINKEVEQRIREMREQAYREGIEKGRMEGADAAMREAMEKHAKQIDEVENMLVDLRQQCESRLEAHKSDIYEMSKRLVKWLVLKEVKDEAYLPKLIEKMILEMNQRQNITLRVHPDDFAHMPQVIADLEKRLGSLTNLRIEPDVDMKGRGVILETENGILDSTPEALFQTIDKMYETVVNHV